ncbi:flagellar biosynthesis protein FlhF [Desulfosporosinus meridiei]|uniref:Flagellar biosynthesis protein FlhF n=1 Tax=Desulfosporosinus meridiei (strain ATCC BAA-275 / DSM 13257 / KCTC 12902 / NCIMB 13706 / S10) TaxID=768704 RepID=U3GJY4_DESMD|nr:flagellar biosynthesis protein FlhF [Desulfosporosinus meridiei]AFQ45736.1 flagellar biosynthetic protein FlhF [Desulfosporosinus meridiei DSM 13257]
MRVRRFVGDNVSETMGKVKRELGSDAVILQTREFNDGGFFGLFGKKKVEITAAIEEAPVIAQKTPTSNFGHEAEAVKPPLPRQVLDTKEQSQDLQAEIKSMRLLLEQMNKQMKERTDLKEEKSDWPSALQRWVDHLRGRGISESLVKRLVSHVQHTLSSEEWADDAKVYARLETNVCQLCGQIGLIQPGIEKPRIVALIGPTGVGKTTTIGKLAAGFSIVDKRRVALITADTYRVAAVEQLKTFGEIIGVPVEVVMTPSGLSEALQLHSDKELIFIDTAGRSPHHELHMSELRSFLDEAQPDFTMLVMSASTQSADQYRIYKRFEDLTTHLIFTKLDETGSAGSILNLIGQTTLPTAYLTNGQNVPDDIEAATPQRLARYIIGEEMPHA